MAIKYVEPVYKVTEKPRTLWEGGVPSGVERALGAVILFTVTQDKDGWGNLEEYKYLSAVFNPGRAKETVMRNIVPRIIYQHPKLKGAEHMAYICPVTSEDGAGYLVGYVVAWNKEDALTVAGYLAGAAV